VVLVVATATLVLTGCSMPWSPSRVDAPPVRGDELADAGDEPCPRELPIDEDPSEQGFGVEARAESLPHLLVPQAAWVCRFDSYVVGRTSGGGAELDWRRTSDPKDVPADRLRRLVAALDELAPADEDLPCTADLGPRWMLVLEHEGDLTGVVVDDYGCRDVRLTDDPHVTAPGARGQEGAVHGVLGGGAAILDAVDL
jgi:hypothetical protein